MSRYTTNFFLSVEKWRALVIQSLHDVIDPSSTYLHTMDAMKLTIEDVTDLVLGIIQKESSGNESEIGDNGNSLGLMQLNYGAGTPQGVGYDGEREGLLDARTNVFYGSMYFMNQLNKYRDVSKALSAFNAGHAISGNIADYVNKILASLGEKKT